MSWFDTTRLASLTKHALKEAQKQIDKALDIQDDLDEDPTAKEKQMNPNAVPADADVVVTTLPSEKSKTAPTTPVTQMHPLGLAKSTDSQAAWGSFTGSFFENPNAKEMITTPPKSGGQRHSVTITEPLLSKRESVTSNSDSIDLLSSPTSPSTVPTSPSENIINSESIELITTPTCSSELISPDSNASLPESIVIIGSEGDHDDDDDSMSYSTVMGESASKAAEMVVIPANEVKSSSESSKPSSIPKSQNITVEEALFESQTVNSDSTQSFEDVQMVEASSVLSDEKDLVKINSGPSSSGHNSNDEIETTTSSDIEIISNPNGDSSSANSASRTSPLKQAKGVFPPPTKKGHFREPSEVSTISEDSQSDTEKLMHRISELSEILESRELRLLEMARQNATLQEKNNEIQSQLDVMKHKTEHLDSEENTQRLSALEKKFQMSIRERDGLRLQLKAAKEELQSKIPKNDFTQVVAEKDQMISELRLEGEKLAKEVLQHSNIIKKLRAKEKTSEAVLKRNKEQISDLTEEVERLKKTLNAKEEVERSQIEAVHKISSEKRKLEEENTNAKSLIEDLTSNLSTVQASLDAAKVELQNRKQVHSDLTKNAQELQTLRKEKEQAELHSQDLVAQLNEMREKLRISEAGMTMREQKLREENSELLRRLEESEIRAENLTQEVSLTTIPLMRQLESLQSTLTMRTSNWNKQEKEFLTQLEISRARLQSLENVESSFKEKVSLLQSRIETLEEKLSASLMQEEQTKIALHQAGLESKLTETNLKRQLTTLTESFENLQKTHDELKQKNSLLEEKYKEMKTTTAAVAAAHKKEEKLAELVNRDSSTGKYRNRDISLSEASTSDETNLNTMRPNNSSPELSLVDDALGSLDWQVDDLDGISNSGRQGQSMYGMHINLPIMNHNASTIEHLTSLVKQRDGEVNQLQWELSRLQVERDVLNSEISNLSMELENMKEKVQLQEDIEKNFADLQRQYDALLQMYGEKVEQAQELELDLQDVKDMYKAQIDELLRQRNASSISSIS